MRFSQIKKLKIRPSLFVRRPFVAGFLVFFAFIGITISAYAISFPIKDKRYKKEFKQNYAIVKAEFFENISLYNGLIDAIRKNDFYYVYIDSIYYSFHGADEHGNEIKNFKINAGKNQIVAPEITAEIKFFYDEITEKTLCKIYKISLYDKGRKVEIQGSAFRNGYRWYFGCRRPGGFKVQTTLSFFCFDGEIPAAPDKEFPYSRYEILNDNWLMGNYSLPRY